MNRKTRNTAILMETGHPVSISYFGILLTIFRNQ